MSTRGYRWSWRGVGLRGHRLRIRTSARPWRNSRGLEEAYIIYTSFEKVLSLIKKGQI
ncbi:MAG: hypothetical protein QXM16_03625 [Nitrososphaerota archaeon]